MNEEFEKWINKNYPGRFCYHHLTASNHMLEGWRGCEKIMQAKIDAQAEEIKALRELLLESANHIANVDNMTVTKWGVVGIGLINEITQMLDR